MKNYFRGNKGQAFAEFTLIVAGSILVLFPVMGLLRSGVKDTFIELDDKMSEGVYMGDGVTVTFDTDGTICHKPGTPAEKTMTLPKSAIPGHLGHGDYLGTCADEVEVTICHKPGKSAEKTLTLPQAAITGHLGHGDYIGTCDDDSNAKITICHQPGTSAEKSMLLPQSAIPGHLGHGDYIGACQE